MGIYMVVASFRRIRFCLLVWLLALCLLFPGSAMPVEAVVTLVSFTVSAGDGQVLLEWETASEIDNAGFYLHRSTAEAGEYARIGPFIPSEGDGLLGASYSYLDQGVQNGPTYYYKLESVATDGSSEFHGPISATPGAQLTATPTATSTSLWTATATTMATLTPSPTAVKTPTATPSPPPTATGTPTRRQPSPPRATEAPTPTATQSPTGKPTSTPTATDTPTRTPTLTATSSPASTALATKTLTITPMPALTATSSPTPTPLPLTTPYPEARMATAIFTPTASRVPWIMPTPIQGASPLSDRRAAHYLWLFGGLLAGLGAWLIYRSTRGRP